MAGIILTLLITLIFVVLYQIGKTSELSAQINGEEAINKKRNNWSAFGFASLFPLLMIGIVYCHNWFVAGNRMLPVSASDHGQKIDQMFMITLWMTGIVFVATQALLFFYTWKFRKDENRRSSFISHNNKLELIWTTIPAIAMFILVIFGLISWAEMTSEPKGDVQIVEVMGKQFNWVMRYPGPDGVLGKRDFRLINDATNLMGLDWKDPKGKDDIIMESGELHLEQDKKVKLIIFSRDVIHDVGLPHFRLKMDAVPGIITSMWFTPIISTDSMKKITGNPKFVYEIACDQMRGKGHFSMQGKVIVHDKGELKKWFSEQKSYYSIQNPPVAEKDTTKVQNVEKTENVENTEKVENRVPVEKPKETLQPADTTKKDKK